VPELTSSDGCEFCRDPLFTGEDPNHPQKIADLDVSTAILNRDWQYYRGSSLLVLRDHVTELHHLEPVMRHRFMEDACRLAAAVEKTVQPDKMNHAVLGNAVPHLHWHLIPRRKSEPFPTHAIWEDEIPQSHFSDEEFRELAKQIRANL
jgi:diadenosine tetraphosphate (Ap4A) HIT family hydrolase